MTKNNEWQWLNDSLEPAENYARKFNSAIETVVGNRTVQSIGMDFLPVVGQMKAVDELYTGRAPVTVYEVSRPLSALALIPGGKMLGKILGLRNN